MRFICLTIIFILSNINFLIADTKKKLDCRQIAHQIEKNFNIPNKLLVSIALTESGTTNSKGKFVSWPWTLNVNGKPYFFENKVKAYNFLLKKIEEGKKNIDIGCMQVSYKYHRKHFHSLKSFLDPQNNVVYAAKYLKKLYEKKKSWNKAISHYHSSNPKRMTKYLAKVHKNWKEERQLAYNQNEILALKPSIKKKKGIDKDKDNKNEEKIKFFRNELAKSRQNYM